MPTSLEGGIAGGGVTGGKGEVGGGGEGAENGLMRTFGAERDSTVTPTIVESACGVIELRVATAALPTESDGEKKQRARLAGATGWIVKPFDPTKLVDAINRVAA